MTTTTHPRPVTPHSILVAELAWLRDHLDEAGADPGFGARLRAATELAVGLDPYVAACTTPESPALRRLAELTRAHRWGDELEQEMLSGHVEGQFLKALVRMARARSVLDIGMFTGYSALAMAEAVYEVAGTDGWVVACEIDAEAAELARAGFDSPAGALVDVRVGPAADTLAALAATGATFDFVFVDADKSGYLGYVDTVLGRDLLAPDGVVCVDNTLMQGQPWRGGEPGAVGAEIAAFNAAVADDPRVEQVLVPLRDGLTILRRVHR